MSRVRNEHMLLGITVFSYANRQMQPVLTLLEVSVLRLYGLYFSSFAIRISVMAAMVYALVAAVGN